MLYAINELPNAISNGNHTLFLTFLTVLTVFMKNLSLLSILAFAVGIFVLASCKKDDDSPKDLLTGQSCWKVVKQESRLSATDPWEAEVVEPCSADDCLNFSDDGNFSSDEGATKCDPSDPETTTGTYVLSEDGKTLTLTEDGISLPFVVTELTSTKLVLSVSFIVENRVTYEAK